MYTNLSWSIILRDLSMSYFLHNIKNTHRHDLTRRLQRSIYRKWNELCYNWWVEDRGSEAPVFPAYRRYTKPDKIFSVETFFHQKSFPLPSKNQLSSYSCRICYWQLLESFVILSRVYTYIISCVLFFHLLWKLKITRVWWYKMGEEIMWCLNL